MLRLALGFGELGDGHEAAGNDAAVAEADDPETGAGGGANAGGEEESEQSSGADHGADHDLDAAEDHLARIACRAREIEEAGGDERSDEDEIDGSGKFGEAE